MDVFVEIVEGGQTDLLTSVSYPPEGIEVGVPAIARTDYAIILTGASLPTDPAIKVVYEVAP